MRVAVGLVVALALAGCAQTAATNETPCSDFSTATFRYAELLTGTYTGLSESEQSELDSFADEFDRVSLGATGEVAARVSAVTEIAQGGIGVLVHPEGYFDASRAVVRACEAEAFDISVATWEPFDPSK